MVVARASLLCAIKVEYSVSRATPGGSLSEAEVKCCETGTITRSGDIQGFDPGSPAYLVIDIAWKRYLRQIDAAETAGPAERL